MTTNRTTRGAIISSILALILCFAMLLGSTFAWFTDSASSSGNKIVSGTLDVDFELLDKDTGVWNSLKGTNAPIFNYDKWEPGYTEVKILKVENLGTLALKWKAVFTSEKDLSALADVIDVYVLPYGVLDDAAAASLAYPQDLTGYTCVGSLASYLNTIETSTYGNLEAGESAYLGIALQMKSDAGNEYQGLDLCGSFDLTIVAAQRMSESDSFGTSYDSGATYPNISLKVPVSTSNPSDSFFKTNTMQVFAPKETVGSFDNNVTDATLKHSEPRVENDSVIFDTVEIYDQNGDVIDLEANNNSNLTVSLYVGNHFSEGDRVKVYHNGEEVAAVVVDANGFITYEVLHFCEIVVSVNTDPETLVVNSVDELLAAFENAKPGTVIDATGVEYTINSADFFYVPGGFTIKGLTVNAKYRGGNYIIYTGSADDVVTFENCTFGNSDRNVIAGGSAGGPNSVVYNNCTFAGVFLSNFVDNPSGVAEFNDCTFTKAPTSNSNYQFTEAMGGTHNYNNCTFDYTGIKQTAMGVITSCCLNIYSETEYSTAVVLNGCTFINCGTAQHGPHNTITRITKASV